MSLPIEIVLVRHGQSEGNVATDRSEDGDHSLFNEAFLSRHSSLYRLTDKGRRQAEMCGKWLRENGLARFDRFYVSSYVRAQETAGLLALPQEEWYVDMNLRERDWGDMDVSSEEQKRTVFGEAMKRRCRDGNLLWKPPNGESLLDVRLRIGMFLDRLHRECTDMRVVVVCHGEVMWVFRTVLERLTAERFRQLDESPDERDHIKNCGILHYSRTNPDPSGRPRQHHSTRWMRSVCPWDTSKSWNEWREIVRPFFSNEELLAIAGDYPRIINEKA